MAKQHFLVSPFGPLTLRVFPEHVHIEAADALSGDWGLGWWHAHHSGDEAVLRRAFWRGELGAEPRPSPGRTELDAFVRQWSFGADLTLETNSLSAGHRSRVQAYAQGFNQARRRRRRETPWVPEDCHLLARTLGFLEWWETRAPQIEFVVNAWQAGLSWDKILDLWPGLGPEPDKVPWAGLRFPPPFSPEARVFVDQLRRFRPGSVFVVPASRSLTGRALLGASYVSDVTDPGLPFLPVLLDTPAGRVRGLSLPGHPGFLAGRTAWLAWHSLPAVDDIVDFRVVAHDVAVRGHWAGTGRAGTLGALLSLENASNIAQAQERTAAGAACLDFAAVDSAGGTARWAHGPRWLRAQPRDAWLPAPWDTQVQTGARAALPEELPLNRVSAQSLEDQLSQTRSSLPGRALEVLRFLLPDDEAGRSLRRWSGEPQNGPDAAAFERLYGEVWTEFWNSSPLRPPVGSALAQTLAPLVDKLVLAPHSAWFPSRDKNHRLGEAVRRAFAPGAPSGPDLLGRRAPKASWKEELAGRPRLFAATAGIVVSLAETGWKVFLTDDETETPAFRSW